MKYQIWADGIDAVWSGQELFAVAKTQLEVVSVTTRPTFASSRPVRVPFGAVGIGPVVAKFDIMPDGRHFVHLRHPGGVEAVPQIQVVLNWLDELKQRVAAR